MQLTFHIFRKDVRRLWPAVLLTLVLLAALGHLDRWRSDSVVDSAEGWLNLVVPMSWVCLIGILVQQESLVGERQFWLTRPYRWSELLAAKVLFAALFIHLPLFLADEALLSFHGFSPLEYLFGLLWTQAMIGATVTVPALALASLCANITQFLLAALLLFGGSAYLEGSSNALHLPWVPARDVRLGIAVLILFTSSTAVAIAQYALRRTRMLRMASAAAVALTAMIVLAMPAGSALNVWSTLHPAGLPASLSLASGTPHPFPGRNQRNPNAQLAIGIAVSGISADRRPSFDIQNLDLLDANGHRILNSAFWGGAIGDEAVFARVDYQMNSRFVLRIDIRRPDWARVQGVKVRLKGTLDIIFHRDGNTDWLAVGESRQTAAGTCSLSASQQTRLYGDAALKLYCESPYPIERSTKLRLWEPKTGFTLPQRLGDSSPLLSGPRVDWLSPLYRRETYFHVAPENTLLGRGDGWLAPPQAMDDGKVGITPDVITGRELAGFDFGDIVLSDYLLR